MRRRIVRAAAVIVLITGASLALAFSTGPPVSRTGAPAVATMPGEGLCSNACHVGNALNDPAGKLEILSLPSQYAPGETYLFTVRLRFAHNPVDSVAPYRWGFQLTAVQAANGRGVGTFNPTGPEQQVLPGTTTFQSRSYLEHTNLGNHDGFKGPVEWLCSWTAPPGDSGEVYFFAAGNATNGDATPAGDHIFTTSDTVNSGAETVSVETGPMKPYGFELAPGYPNPFTRFTDFAFSVPRDGIVDFAIFDVMGRRVKTLRSGFRKAGLDGLTWYGDREDGTHAPTGVYFAKLRVAGEKDALTQRVTLMR